MFRDSFSTAMLPYLAEHFRSAVFLWRSFDATVVEQEKPDIVIEEIAERVIPYSPAMP
jgi:hypothetical protein